MPLLITLLVLAVFGVIDAGYLVWRHYKKGPLICPLHHDCSVVTESEWAKIFGIRNDILGIMYYLVVIAGVISALALQDYRMIIYQGLGVISSMAALFSLLLMYVQRYVIKDYCFYCILSTIISLLIAINTFVLIFT